MAAEHCNACDDLREKIKHLEDKVHDAEQAEYDARDEADDERDRADKLAAAVARIREALSVFDPPLTERDELDWLASRQLRRALAEFDRQRIGR